VTGTDATSRTKRTVDVELLGRRFRVRSDDDDTYIHGLVDYLNRKMSEVRKAANVVEGEHIALLTLLDVADALFRERDKSASLERGVRERAEKLLSIIDRLGEASPEAHEVVVAAVSRDGA